MIGLDTNVLIRYLVQDDAIQSHSANQLIERRLTAHEPGFVSVVTIVETAWVLERTYGVGELQIAAAIEALLATDVLIIEREQEVFTAMISLKGGLGSFADALIGILGASAGCSATLTFDRKASRLVYFELLR